MLEYVVIISMLLLRFRKKCEKLRHLRVALREASWGGLGAGGETQKQIQDRLKGFGQMFRETK